MPGTMSVGGLASGLQTDQIISKIMEYARLPQKNMQADQLIAKSKLVAWQEINTRVMALKTSVNSVADTIDFKLNSITSSDTDILTASATADAAPGTYYLKVTQRAQVHQVASNNTYATTNDVIGTGTVSFAFTNDATKNFSVNIDSNNNTLSGLRDAINHADKGVQAVIVNSGSSTTPQYQLLLTTADSGTNSAFTVSNTLAGGTAPDLTRVVQQGIDAQITFGQGAGALSVTKSSNTITDLIPGVTLNIASADASKTIKLDVTRDTESIKKSIQGFVDQYNSFSDSIKTNFKFDTKTNETGTLFGDYQLQMVQQDIASTVGNIVTGLNSQYNALASIGITRDTDGHLAINDKTLSDALANNLDDVSRVFGADLNSDSTYVSYAASTSSTQSSGNTKWSVNVTQAARRSQVTAGVAMSAPLGADEKLTINGKEVFLTSGMTLDNVITAINAKSNESGVTAVRTGADGTGTGDFLTLRRMRYGSSTNFSVLSTVSNASAGTTGVGNVLIAPNVPAGQNGLGVGLLGLDVEGTINGLACTGSGQILTAKPPDSSTNAAKGLSLVVTADAPMATNVQFTKGIGSSLRDLLSTMTSSKGIVTQAQESLNTRISNLTDLIADNEVSMQTKQEQLYAKFTAMESQMSKLQGQGNYISSMLSSNSSSK
ncbi:MAG: flagellar filament capping protein FliD [Armatimonadota bacterium]